MSVKKPAQPIKDKSLVLDFQDYLKDKNERDYVLFITGISTGYRAGDLVKLKARDIRKALECGYFEILEGKKLNSKNIKKENMKARTVKLISSLAKILRKYIENKKDYEYAFPSRKGKCGHIKVASYGKVLKETGKAFGLKNISAHTMRKTYAYSIYVDSGYNITLIKEMLGHSDSEITKRYLGLDQEEYDKYSDTLNHLIR